MVKNGDGLELDLFTCGGYGRQSVQGLDELFALSPEMLHESSGKFGEQWHDNISLTHYLWSGAGVWTV